MKLLYSNLVMTMLVSTYVSCAFASPTYNLNGKQTINSIAEDIRTDAIREYKGKRGFRPRTDAAKALRTRLSSLPSGLALAPALTLGQAVRGDVEVPVFLATFSNTTADPYPSNNLNEQLFGTFATGTMTEYYSHASGGLLNVLGNVSDWHKLSKDDDYYAGADVCSQSGNQTSCKPCAGLCQNSKLAEMIESIISAADNTTDFSLYDNDGPDGIPNSGDDDGFVDFVAFVHPEAGSECGDSATQKNIWSHRFSYRSLTAKALATEDVSALGSGSKISIDDYVIMPALACDQLTMNQIGVFTHEFAHAFGVPDLYDTSSQPRSSAIGTFGLMGAGSWGGDMATPESPAQMISWSKEFLGWSTPQIIDADRKDVIITEGSPVKVDYDFRFDPRDDKYLLLEYRTRGQTIDTALPSEGLLITEISNSKTQSGIVSNNVNQDPNNLGIRVIEADGRQNLLQLGMIGEASDVFPGSESVTSVDNSHPQRIRAAICNIRMNNNSSVTADIYTSRQSCPVQLFRTISNSNTKIDGFNKPDDALKALSSGEVLLGEGVTIEGILKNSGTNFFTDRRLTISDPSNPDIQIPVFPNLPVSTSLSAGGISAENLSDFIGKRVVVEGQWTRDMVKGIGLTDTISAGDINLLPELKRE